MLNQVFFLALWKLYKRFASELLTVTDIFSIFASDHFHEEKD